MQFDAQKKFITQLLTEGYSFVIPLYQRPYRWGIKECEDLWDDIVRVFDKRNLKNFEEYFLGSIVTYRSEDNKRTLDIIDGQQRLTTLSLLFRAFYESFKNEQQTAKQEYIKRFGKCLWKYDIDKEIFLFENPYLQSKVITERDLEILKVLLGEKIDLNELKNNKTLLKNNYAKNYIFFYDKLLEFKQERTLDWKDFCKIFVDKQCFFVLLIVCDSQTSAMTIFNTLNSRGKPLANADILKGHIYEKTQHKEEFAQRWKELESKEENEKINSLDFLFTQLMYIAKAEADDTDTTVPSIVAFFAAKGNREYLDIDKNDTMNFLAHLADFWIQPENYLNDKTMMYMSVLDKFPNASWKSFVSCLVWKNKQHFENEEFDKESFSKDFENLLILIKLITLPFLNRQTETKLILERVFKINANILHNRDLLIKHNEKYTFPVFESFYTMFKQNDTKKLKYILFLYAYIFNKFEETIDDTKLEVEHILPKQWQNANFDGWDKETHEEYLEQIGNKMLLEKKLNIKCKDSFFAKKQEEYKKSKLQEAKKLALREKNKWDKEDIEQRNKEIYEALKDFLSFQAFL